MTASSDSMKKTVFDFKYFWQLLKKVAEFLKCRGSVGGVKCRKGSWQSQRSKTVKICKEKTRGLDPEPTAGFEPLENSRNEKNCVVIEKKRYLWKMREEFGGRVEQTLFG